MTDIAVWNRRNSLSDLLKYEKKGLDVDALSNLLKRRIISDFIKRAASLFRPVDQIGKKQTVGC